MSTLALAMTLASESWMAVNKWRVLQAIPKDWTEMTPRNLLIISHKLDRMGVKQDDDDEIVKVLVFLERRRFVQRQGDKIRRHPMQF